METQQHSRVAVLLTTYNGAPFVEPQIKSLTQNVTPFTLHWLDDHSTDKTREVVRSSALSSGIKLCEWHQPQRQGFPRTFFQLVECVDADIYLFCDQDDIWQPGKIDATVANLVPDSTEPMLCFSDCLVFNDGAPGVFHRFSHVIGVKVPDALQESRSFILTPALGHTMGFTRPLREMCLRHADIARAYAFGHDAWMYLIAVASGSVRMLSSVPTTLYRRHGNNTTKASFGHDGRIIWTWKILQHVRRGTSRQAEGFLLASASLPPGQKLERMAALARLLATLDRRQSPTALVRLVRRGAMWPNRSVTVCLAAACLCSDAKPPLSVDGAR